MFRCDFFYPEKTFNTFFNFLAYATDVIVFCLFVLFVSLFVCLLFDLETFPLFHSKN